MAAGQRLGLSITPSPLHAIEPVAWSPPDPAAVGGLLLGSANAARHGGPGLARLRLVPAYVVGKATAHAARAAGLAVAGIGAGGLQAVLDGLAPQARPLLRLAGEVHLPLVPPEGLGILTRIVYRSRALPLPAPIVARLAARGGLVLLHSAQAASHFAAECDRAGLARAQVALAALGPRIAAAAGEGWAASAWPPEPSDHALLALAGEMGYCGSPG